MTGKRPLTHDEFTRLYNYLKRNRPIRDRLIISLSYYTGYRIKEVLSMRVKDVYCPDGTVRSAIHLEPKNMKRKRPRPAIDVHSNLECDLREYWQVLESEEMCIPSLYLIQSQKGENKAISYTQAYRIIKDVFDACDVYDNVACHSFRKSFAEDIYQASGKDIRLTQEFLGHKSPATTARYVGVNKELGRKIIMGR